MLMLSYFRNKAKIKNEASFDAFDKFHIDK